MTNPSLEQLGLGGLGNADAGVGDLEPDPPGCGL
jgi:hypothetical protein